MAASDRHGPNPLRQGLEAKLARHTVRRAFLVGPVIVGVFWALRGASGAIAAAIGVVVVVGYILLYGVMLSLAARLSLGAYYAAALFGFFVRTGLIAAVLLVVAALIEVDRFALGISVVASYLVLLSWEAAAVALGRERELEWTS